MEFCLIEKERLCRMDSFFSKPKAEFMNVQFLILLIYLLALGGGPTFFRVFFYETTNLHIFTDTTILSIKNRFSKLTGDGKNSGSVDTDRRPAGSHGYQRDQGRPQPRRG
jgi:hypothetical protein